MIGWEEVLVIISTKLEELETEGKQDTAEYKSLSEDYQEIALSLVEEKFYEDL